MTKNEHPSLMCRDTNMQTAEGMRYIFLLLITYLFGSRELWYIKFNVVVGGTQCIAVFNYRINLMMISLRHWRITKVCAMEVQRNAMDRTGVTSVVSPCATVNAADIAAGDFKFSENINVFLGDH